MTRLGVQFIGSVLENSARTRFGTYSGNYAGSKVGAASRSTTVNPETVEGAARHVAEADDDGDFDGPAEDDHGWSGAADDDGGFDGLVDSFSGPVDDDDVFGGPVNADGGFRGATDDDDSFSAPADMLCICICLSLVTHSGWLCFLTLLFPS